MNIIKIMNTINIETSIKMKQISEENYKTLLNFFETTLPTAKEQFESMFTECSDTPYPNKEKIVNILRLYYQGVWSGVNDSITDEIVEYIQNNWSKKE